MGLQRVEGRTLKLEGVGDSWDGIRTWREGPDGAYEKWRRDRERTPRADVNVPLGDEGTKDKEKLN